MWKTAKMCGELALVFDKRLKYVGNDLEIREVATIFGKCIKSMAHGLSI